MWNLAAPLSVETALDPAVAEAVTMGGMSKVLTAMREVGARRICFTDSIGSFGAEAPRSGATARWLTENPTQDPGSDYGRQKRGCRELMAEFASAAGGDPRFAVRLSIAWRAANSLRVGATSLPNRCYPACCTARRSGATVPPSTLLMRSSRRPRGSSTSARSSPTSPCR